MEIPAESFCIVSRKETLQQAIHHRNAGLVKKLLECGADANGTADGKTMLFHAMDNMDPYSDPRCDCDFQDFECDLCVAKSVELKNSDVLQIFYELLKHGANPNTPTTDGDSLLISIINIISSFRNNYMKIVELLLQYGCDANATSGSADEFVTPLIAATDNENFRMVQLLIKNGADVEGLDSCARTAMHVATDIDSPAGMKIMEVLLQNGVDLEKKYRNIFYKVDETLIHHVANAEFYDGKIELVLKYGGDINETTSGNQTALIIAFENRRYQNVEAFTKHIAKMRLCQLPVNLSDMRWIIDHAVLKNVYQTAYDNYSKMAEMEELKKEVVYGNITMYRVLSNDLKRVIPFLRNKDVRKYFESAKFEKFPVFGSCIKQKYRQALKMKYLLDIGEQVLFSMMGKNLRRPSEAIVAIEQILSYFDMDDLVVFTEYNDRPDEEYNISGKDIKEMKLSYKRKRRD